jgi:hypothetical protein
MTAPDVELHRILIHFGKIFAQWPDPPGNQNFKVRQEDSSSSMVHSSMQIAGQNSVQFNMEQGWIAAIDFSWPLGVLLVAIIIGCLVFMWNARDSEEEE